MLRTLLLTCHAHAPSLVLLLGPPLTHRYELIQPGEPAELVVLSGDTSFLQFKVRQLLDWLRVTTHVAAGAARSPRFAGRPCSARSPHTWALTSRSPLFLSSCRSPQAVKDVYLPNSGLWVSEYPHCDRTQLLEISLAVEREAEEAAGGYGPEAEEEEEAEEQQQWYGGGGGEQPYGGGGDNRGGWQQSGEWRY